MRTTLLLFVSLILLFAVPSTQDQVLASVGSGLHSPPSRTEHLLFGDRLSTSEPQVPASVRRSPSLPFLTQNVDSYRSLKTAEDNRQGSMGTRLPMLPGERHPSNTPTGVAFAGMDLSTQASRFGRGQIVAPPDTQLAAGPTALVEAVNSSMSTWSKNGDMLDAVDLGAFFDLPNGYFFTDPWVVYDPASSRFFIAGLAFNLSIGSFIVAAVSDSSDPTSTWTTFSTDVFPNTLADQPKLGASGDKVVISWNDFVGNTFTGQETWVLEKADLVAGAELVRAVAFGPDTDRFTVVPARTMTSSSTEYLAFTNANALRSTLEPTLGVVSITGTPSAGNVAWTESTPQIQSMALAPYAVQPWGDLLDTGDNRALSAVWENNTLWVGANDKCSFAQDSTLRACLRLIQVSTASSPATVLDDFDIGIPGRYLSYPALALDSGGDLHVVFSISSSKVYASVMTSGVSASTGDLLPAVTLAVGTGPFDFNGNSRRPSRWGDYSGASTDPSDPTVVWLAGEYAASDTFEFNWGTAIGQQEAAIPGDTRPPSLSGIRDAPDPFTPNGDGRADATKIHWRLSEGAVVTDEILSPHGRVVFRLTSFVTKGYWYDTWNGRSQSGRPEPSGRYRYVITAVDAAGNSARPAKGTITLIR
jgi:hypothetical protein